VANKMAVRVGGPVRWICVLLIAGLAATGLAACGSDAGAEELPAASQGAHRAWPPVTEYPPLPPAISGKATPAGATATTPESAPPRESHHGDGVHTPYPSSRPSDYQPTAGPTFVPAESMPLRLVMPSIRLDAPIVPIGWHQVGDSGNTAWDDPGAAAGWLESSALPGGGSNVVLAGHHNIRGEVFRDLIDVLIGDDVYLIGEQTVYPYRVVEHFIVPEKHASVEQREQNGLWIAPTVDERLTLVTCWPYRGNTHRLIVVARPDPDAPLVPHLASSAR